MRLRRVSDNQASDTAMLNVFRKMTKSKFGVAAAAAFLILILISFAGADVAGSGKFGGVAGGDRAAIVGSRRVSTSELSQAATAAVEQAKREHPTATMKMFLAQNGLASALEQIIDGAAIAEFGKAHGIVAGDRLVDSEIVKIPAFRGADGQFSESTYKQLIAQRGMTDASLRQDFADSLIAKQVLIPASFGSSVPKELVIRYAALLTETRNGSIAMLPASAFAPPGEPSPAELTAYYTAHRDAYIRPERRVIRYAMFDDSAIKNVPAPSEAEITARYSADKVKYAPSETRKLTQLILPTQAAAQAIAAEVAKGGSLDSAARSKGLATATIPAVTSADLAAQSSQAVADTVFAAKPGTLAGPAKSGLGWHVIRVDAVTRNTGKTLDQARGEISAALAAEKKRAALSDFSAKIEDEFDKGGSLTDVAKELGLTLVQTEPLTADGQVYGKPGATGPAELARVYQTAFAMEQENQSQLAEVIPGKAFVVFDVTSITPSAPAPISEIRANVVADLMLQKGAAAAKAAAEKVQAAVRKGTDLGAAVAALGKPLPPIDQVYLNRSQLTKSGQAVPPPLALMFSMAQGTVKSLSAPQNRGWYVVSLKTITPGKMDASDPTFAAAKSELGKLAGREYAEQMRAAIRAEVGVTRNSTAINAVARQLTGGN
ncbi:MAG: peptidyl-prolyl cis-trans isomerase [Novosphingobium sp.]